jgi:cysteine desulfurase
MGWHLLDHAAGAPARPEVVDVMLPYLTEAHGNPSGAHALARQARAALDDARERLAAVVGCRPGELVFTSGGTEADDLAVRGVLGAATSADGSPRALCTEIEHPAVREPVLRAGGATVPVDAAGRVDLDALEAALGLDVALVSVATVSNELGVVHPVGAVAELVRERAPHARVHTDAAQALSWLDVAGACEPADLVSLASHKCGGPKGIGALVVREGTAIEPQLVGGGQERGRRAGTPNVAGAVGFALAAERAAAERASLVARADRWRRRVVGAVLAGVPGAVETVAGEPGRSPQVVPGIVHLCVPEVDSEALLFLLEQDHSVLAAAGSSCSSGALTVSAAALAVGVEPRLARGALRLSFGWSTTDADVDAAIEGIVDAATRLRAHAREGTPA